VLRPDRLPGDGDELQRKRWLHAFDDDGLTALHLAVQGGHVGCVRALVDAGFDVNTKSKTSLPPMMQALIDAGIDIEVRSDDIFPALLLTKDAEIARILLDAGAEDYYRTIIFRACEDPDRIEVLRLLLQRLPDSEAEDDPYLGVAVKAGNLEAVRALVAARPPGYINVRDDRSCSALHYADANAMRLLLELGADPRVVNSYLQTPLMKAGDAACVRLLLEAAPDVIYHRDSRGQTVVMRMSHLGEHYELLEELLRYCREHGIDAGVNYHDSWENTALFLAIPCPRTVELLLEHGADPLASGRGGKTVVMQVFSYTYVKDDVTSASIKAMLDAVLLRERANPAVVEAADAE
jgi:ankyrin repeat protein